MPILKVIVLAIVQGLAELLPVSSSAHVVVAEKLMGLDPSSPQMTLLLVMLHTGTMFAVIVYFWKQWKKTYFANADAFKRFLIRIIWATFLTGLIGGALKVAIEKTMFHGAPKAEIEELFGRLDLIAPALLAAGVLILIAGLRERKGQPVEQAYGNSVTMRQAGWMGAVQGLCLPFRGFSRSGATISTGMLADASKDRAERFSFALAVVLTPPVVLREAMRLVKASREASTTGAAIDLHSSVATSLIGMVLAFFAGLVALRWLSAWLEEGRWYLFGIYCLLASGAVFYLHHLGY
ncbi:undecaprenyl-diphosphate phosphatase [Edaphobacter albus]|uniref:undecaprenyl-diphosphate phosphatase n=1 Tax=Edaphobacter sp. 4G125 TaxID=2763071 RepID=UPI001649791A|nr:undecaprenyl-diphosphate phosphatase [Edaphobacter sp. 4G125]QNI36533.1 undecaprenyl-diphosphate phosphatase [Edaphobacter sp. 4G125]